MKSGKAKETGPEEFNRLPRGTCDAFLETEVLSIGSLHSPPVRPVLG